MKTETKKDREQTAFWIPCEMKRELERRARENERSVSAEVRRLLAEALKGGRR